ncbi:hypothetical protein F441_12921 [Phytophthora nicotianae CJ01A1]|uniref:BZIP domain-containing protein n=1 Tax=Phytophthora nicotianae CJ01A1 TaxID=1317063 RepID=W2WPR2_PHYNI|nr:hypothetical protein F441_12921 [Phytophthora nicotianae CJ01A1]
MKVSTLFPPNREHVSDVVIGSVILRSEHYYNYYRNDTSEWRTDRCSPTSSSSSAADIKSGLDFIDASRLPGITGHKRAHTDTLNCRTPYSELHQAHAVSSAIDFEAKYAAELEFRRRRNRIHKARYKMKQRKLEMDLVESVANLKDEVQELKMQYRLLSYRIPTTTTIWVIAAEYFRLFRHGIKGPVIKKEPVLTATTTSLTINQAQRHFIETVMADDVTDGVIVGIQAFIDSIALHYQCYDEIDLRPLHMVYGPGDSLVVTTKCELTITDKTLYHGFPNLVKHGKWSFLAGKMLGKKIVINGSMHVARDYGSKRVTRLQWQADLMIPLLRLLGSLEAVARVFNSARLSPNGMVMSSDSL